MIGKERYKRTKGYIDKYGNLTVFVFNSLPLSSSVLSLVAGMLRYNFKNLVIYSFLGLLLKYIIVVFLFG
jgi:membrane protein DedA with SNARE-associated domain